MILYLLIILISGIVAVKDLSKAIDGYIDVANPEFLVLFDMNLFRRKYGKNSLFSYTFCLLSMLSVMVAAGLRLFRALDLSLLLWLLGISFALLIVRLIISRHAIKNDGSDQVERQLKEKWEKEKRVAPEHNEEVDLYRAAVRSNRTVTWLSWHLAGIIAAGLILLMTL